ncbi:MAG: DUF4258 domain-containing protein [Candidatus Dormibacteraceae bacterium]
MPKINIEEHAKLRMRQRQVTAEDIAYVWQHYDAERPAEVQGFVVRTGRVPDGRAIEVVAKLTPQIFHVKTVWEIE